MKRQPGAEKAFNGIIKCLYYLLLNLVFQKGRPVQQKNLTEKGVWREGVEHDQIGASTAWARSSRRERLKFYHQKEKNTEGETGDSPGFQSANDFMKAGNVPTKNL